MILEKRIVGPLMVNCYILACEDTKQAIIIDPGADKDKIAHVLKKHNLKAAFIINTHGHFDHIGCDDDFGFPVYIHRDDVLLLKDSRHNLSAVFSSAHKINSKIIEVEDKQVIKLGSLELEVMHTPGHTPGGICLLLRKPKDNIIFTGDTLFAGGIGRTDFPGASENLLLSSIREKLFKLDDKIIIYPGHGPASSIGEEKSSNPFL